MTTAVKTAVAAFVAFTATLDQLQAAAYRLNAAVEQIPADDLDGTELRARFVQVRPAIAELGRQISRVADIVDPTT